MTKLPKALSRGEEEFALQCRAYGLTPIREYRFHPVRLWRLDFAWPEEKIGVEIEGVMRGIGGRHQQTDGLVKDAEKYNAAAKLGWRILRYTSRMVTAGTAINDVLELLGRK